MWYFQPRHSNICLEFLRFVCYSITCTHNILKISIEPTQLQFDKMVQVHFGKEVNSYHEKERFCGYCSVSQVYFNRMRVIHTSHTADEFDSGSCFLTSIINNNQLLDPAKKSGSTYWSISQSSIHFVYSKSWADHRVVSFGLVHYM